MKYRIGAALAVAAILTGSALVPMDARADDNPQAAAEAEASTVNYRELQKELDARLQRDAEIVAADAMTAASDLDLELEPARVSPRTLVLVSDL